jgi:hypothetical protein
VSYKRKVDDQFFPELVFVNVISGNKSDEISVTLQYQNMGFPHIWRETMWAVVCLQS